MTGSIDSGLQDGSSLRRLWKQIFCVVLFFSNEGVFHLSGIANITNTHIWVTENPRAIQGHEIHREKIAVRCGVHSEGVLDPY